MNKGWLFSILVLSSCAPSLAGQIRGNSGEIIASREARVNITRLDTPSDGVQAVNNVVVAVVDQSGRYATTESLPHGHYLVEALVPGYAPQSKKVDLADKATVDLTLTPVVTAKIQATSTNSHVDEDRGAGRATLTPPSL